uniref:Uncharacterized protein n=2 Tax=Babesia bovis TaxID=5865 RepID=A7APB6_BABBO|eukprot:XP_001611968.1 hypothetical protein [Babesia bovis T2Bo]
MPTVPLGLSKLKCGEIVIGVPQRWNDDGGITVDIGAETPLIVDEETLVFLGANERRRLESILVSLGANKTAPQKSLDDMINDTITLAGRIPERKRKTMITPKILGPQDAIKDMESTHLLSYDLGVCGEIKPRSVDTPHIAGRKQPHCWFRDDQMEFLITDIDIYGHAVKGEIWSPSIVERRRQAYMALAVESVKPSSSITAYKALIKERDGDLLRLQFVDEHLRGFNVFAIANPKDKENDTVMVYLAACDPALQHVYCTRKSVSNEQLRAESLKLLYDEIIFHYVKTGKWFRACYEINLDDSLQLRIVGKNANDYDHSALIFLHQMPYFSPEGILNETFRQLNEPNDHFIYHDIMINVGKLNYGFNYDNTMFVRIHEFKTPSLSRNNVTKKTLKSVSCIELSTLNICKPEGTLLEGFKKLTQQTLDDLKELRINTSYPCMILGQDDGYLYLAVNYTRKDNFSLEDPYLVGIMRIIPKSKLLPPGSFVHGRVLNISQHLVNRQYLENHSEVGGHDSFQYTAFTYWLNKINEGKQVYGISRFELQKTLNLVWMDGLCLPAPGSPQYDKFFALQPLMTEAQLTHTVDESLTPFCTEDFIKPTVESDGQPMAPESITTAFLKAMKRKQREAEHHKQLPIDMKEFGTFVLRYDDEGEDAMAAAPCFYIHNRELRLAMIESQLTRHALRKFKRTIEMSRMSTEGEIKSFFYDSKGRSFYEILQGIRNPMYRRSLKPNDAFQFERNIKLLLSGIQDFYLESIYDATDREQLIFASLVPRSGKTGDFVQMDELSEFDHYLRNDFVMDPQAKDSLRRVLSILTHPNNSLMAHMRHRHRTIEDDVFYSYRKMLHYDTWEDYKMPEEELDKIDPFHGPTSPLPPISELVTDPEDLATQLHKRGYGPAKSLYSLCLRMHRTPVSDYVERSLVRMNEDQEQRLDATITPEDIDEYVREELKNSESTDSTIDNKPRKVRITAQEWRKLNKLQTGFNAEELKEYLREIKAFQPVHGVRLPIL